MATSIWFRSGDTQIRKTIFEPAYSTATASGATCEFFEGGTTTPLVVFGDSGANQSLGSNITVDGNARWPSVFLVTGTPYKYIIRDFTGEIIDTADNVPNPDVVSGVIPPGDGFQTGDTVFRHEDGTRVGFVRLNGRTIGSTASGATERANDDTQALYEQLWNNVPDSTMPVIGGRGASSSADFLANKPLTLTDGRGASLMGLDTMGNTAGGFLASTPFTTGDATTVGSLAGYNAKLIAIAEFESHTHGVGTLVTELAGSHTHGSGSLGTQNAGTHGHTITDPQHSHTVNQYRTQLSKNNAPSSTTYNIIDPLAGDTGVASLTAATGISINSNGDHNHPIVGTTAVSSPETHLHTISGASEAVGGTDAYNVVHRAILGTFFIKL